VKKKLFLLGGYDLEMLEIKSILDAYKISYVDKKLSWGSKLSEYKNELNFDGIIYAVELEEDITPPANYIQIDHHGINDNNPSSLEQVASILDISLNRKQELISANDSRYIEGMKLINASEDEINEIRKQDRKAQGITNEDEILAKKSIERSSSHIVYSLTEKFSVVSDFIYYIHEQYIIYNDRKIIFYNYEKNKIIEYLEKYNITINNYYHGGGEFGFVGIKENILNKNQIKKIIKEFKYK